jgi:tellurite methyltransferase
MTPPSPPSSDPPAGKSGGVPPKAQHYAEKRDWPGYFKVVLGKPPRETLVSALERFEQEGRGPGSEGEVPLAIDLGCGEGRDTLELLKRGWQVLAIDSHPQAFDLLLPRVPTGERERLRAMVAPFEGLKLEPVRLVNASFSLPFCEPAHFDALWAELVRVIEPGGRFAGQLFGDRDSWAKIADRSHQRESRARELLADFEVEEFRVEEKDDNDAGGNPKHWHVFHVVAMKRGGR